MRFTATWSGLLIGVSVFASLILIFVSGLFLTRPDVPTGFKVAVIASCMGTLFTSLLFTVRGYRIEMGCLYIERLIWDTRIDLRHLRSVEADPDAMARAWRTFGNGGLFSFSGWFRNIYDAVTTSLVGMSITIRYFFTKPVTVEYPEERLPVAPRYRSSRRIRR